MKKRNCDRREDKKTSAPPSGAGKAVEKERENLWKKEKGMRSELEEMLEKEGKGKEEEEIWKKEKESDRKWEKMKGRNCERKRQEWEWSRRNCGRKSSSSRGRQGWKWVGVCRNCESDVGEQRSMKYE